VISQTMDDLEYGPSARRASARYAVQEGGLDF
jgi:hypothetical protein